MAAGFRQPVASSLRLVAITEVSVFTDLEEGFGLWGHRP